MLRAQVNNKGTRHEFKLLFYRRGETPESNGLLSNFSGNASHLKPDLPVEQSVAPQRTGVLAGHRHLKMSRKVCGVAPWKGLAGSTHRTRRRGQFVEEHCLNYGAKFVETQE